MKKSKRKKTFQAYKRLLEKDYDWDYGFMIALEKKKLQRMLKWWETKGNPMTDAKFVIRDLRLALKLLKVSEGEDYDSQILSRNPIGVTPEGHVEFKGPEDWWKGISPKVNFRNSSRFLPRPPREFLEKTPWVLREAKGWYLYNKLRAYRMQTWWD